MGDVLHRHLTILRGVADVLRVRADDVGELGLEGLDHVARFVKRERGLGEVGDLVRVRDYKCLDLLQRRDNLSHIRGLTLRAFHLFVVAVSNQHQRVTLLGELDGFDVDLGHQRAGRIDHLEAALLGALPDRRGDTVRGVDHARPLGHLVQFVDEDCALLGQVGDDVAVVDDLLANVDRCAKGLEGDPDDIDGPDDTRTKAARL